MTILMLIAVMGELPVSQALRFVTSPSYLKKIVTRLKNDGLIHTYYSNGLRGYRLSALGKKLMLREMPKEFSSIFEGKPSINQPKYGVADRLRLHRMAEANATMLLADIAVFPWEKPQLFENGFVSDSLLSCSPVYYTSFEVKEIGAEAGKIRGARATGILLTPNFDYAVYNTGNVEMKWKYQSEVRFKTLVRRELAKAREDISRPIPELDAIILASNMDQLLNLMDVIKQKKHDYFVLDGIFKHFYYITNDSYGEFLLQFLCDTELKDSLDVLLVGDLLPCDPQAAIENDGYDGKNRPVLLGYLCDMPRIKRFDHALSMRNMSGTLICFDFQAETMRKVCSSHIEIQTIDFEAVKGGITDQ